MPAAFPSIYVILDAALIAGAREANPTLTAAGLAGKLAMAGVKLMQYRDKRATARALYETGLEILRQVDSAVRLVLNDRPDVAALIGAGGVHVGQEDLPVAAARSIVGPHCWVGVSTHTLEQLREADGTSADYVAFGPIFPTTTKLTADPPVGVEGVRQARALTRKPLVAIGGITLERAEGVWRAGADSIAVSRDVVLASDSGVRVRQFLAKAAAVFGTDRRDS